MNVQSFDKILKRVQDKGCKYARIYEGKHADYPTNKPFFESFDVDGPDELEKALAKFANENTGRFTIFLGVNGKNPNGMAKLYTELKDESMKGPTSESGVFMQYLIDRNNRLEEKIEALAKENQPANDVAPDMWATIADRVTLHMFGPSPGPPANAPQLNGLDKDTIEQELQKAIETLLEVFDPQTMVNLADKIKRPENAHIIDMVKNFANG